MNKLEKNRETIKSGLMEVLKKTGIATQSEFEGCFATKGANKGWLKNKMEPSNPSFALWASIATSANPLKHCNGDFIGSFLMQLDKETQDRFHQLERRLAGLTKYFGHLDKDRAALEHLGVY
jgi:hypothetical protein